MDVSANLAFVDVPVINSYCTAELVEDAEHQRTLLALCLQQIDGLGRVGIRRLLDSFRSLEELASCPLEQIIVRLKGIANASAIAARLHDQEETSVWADRAKVELDELLRRNVKPLTSGCPEWPDSLSKLPNRFAPAIVYCYGATSLLTASSVAFVSEAEIGDEAFGHLQRLASAILSRQIAVISGVESGVDVVLAKLSVDSDVRVGRSICVANTGLAKIPSRIRPIVSQVARNGGVLVSSFAMAHGPFSHDSLERTLIQSALGTVVVLCGDIPDPDEASSHPFNQVARYCHDVKKPVFSIGGHSQRTDIHPLRSESDDEWVIASVQGS